MLYLAQGIILPLIYAIIIATLLSPAVDFLVRKKLNRIVSILIVFTIALLILSGLIALIASQASMISRAWPKLIDKFTDLLAQAVTWSSACFHISTDRINEWLANTKAELTKNSSAAIGTTLVTMSGIVQATILTPVYVLMVLFYHPHLLAFAHQIFGADNDEKVSEILLQTKTIIKSYLIGLFIEFIIIAILNSIGLLALRIDYAVMLGIIGAALNVIPIIGGVICILLFVIVALVTKSAIYMVYVVIVYAVIQFIDDHYIFPKIVGAKVKLNLLISVITVIVGDALWGIPGMFLAIPLTAIVKLVLDHIEPLKPWGFLLGDTVPEHEKMKFSFIIKGFIQKLTPKKEIKP
jgi:predicted PurR-regulated permease PerM